MRLLCEFALAVTQTRKSKTEFKRGPVFHLFTRARQGLVVKLALYVSQK